MGSYMLKLMALVLALGAMSVRAEGDVAAGKTKFYACEGCHSIPGYTNTYPTFHVPRIGGQHQDYILSALNAYKTGERTHGSMTANSSSLSEQDMQDLAAYISKFRSMNATLPVKGDIAKGMEKAKACASCHGDDGNSDMTLYPRLAGQHQSYLMHSLKQYKEGTRKNAIMGGFAMTLDEKDIEDLSAYYASRKKGLIEPIE